METRTQLKSVIFTTDIFAVYFKKHVSLAGARTHEIDYFGTGYYLGSAGVSSPQIREQMSGGTFL